MIKIKSFDEFKNSKNVNEALEYNKDDAKILYSNDTLYFNNSIRELGQIQSNIDYSWSDIREDIDKLEIDVNSWEYRKLYLDRVNELEEEYNESWVKINNILAKFIDNTSIRFNVELMRKGKSIIDDIKNGK